MSADPKQVFDDLSNDMNRHFVIAMRRWALEMERAVALEIDRMGLSVTGDLRKSVTHRISEEGERIAAQVGTGLKNPAPYPVYVHEGTKPHMPPLKPILKWVRKKGLAGSFSVKTKRRLGSKKTQTKEDLKIAEAIRWKISHVGTKPHPFLKNVFDKEGPLAAQKIAKELFKEYRKLKARKVKL